jgi:hypothetical protein
MAKEDPHCNSTTVNGVLRCRTARQNDRPLHARLSLLGRASFAESRARVLGRAAQCFFDSQQFVILGDAIRAAGRASLDLSHSCRDGQMSDSRIFRLATTVADDARMMTVPGAC